MTASRIRKIRSKIRTWKIWISSGLFGFNAYYDARPCDMATPREPAPDAIVYGFTLEDALRRFARKRPWSKVGECRFEKTNGVTFARVMALPNHGLFLSGSPWILNRPSDLAFCM